VLVVDDEADTCEVLQFILEGRGALVKTACSAAAALEAVAEEEFVVLISDIGMADEDSYPLIAKVRALGQERGGKVPAAAALTAYAGEEAHIRALQSGFQIHVPKPISQSELLAVVANLAGRMGFCKSSGPTAVFIRMRPEPDNQSLCPSGTDLESATGLRSHASEPRYNV
jgi:hypothetical protein